MISCLVLDAVGKSNKALNDQGARTRFPQPASPKACSDATLQRNGHHFRVPAGPSEPFDTAEDLLAWMNKNSARYGDIFKTSVMGSDVYVVSNPAYCERILRQNWRNYPRKGLVVRRIALLRGNGLITSNGEFWARQRRMIQPAFSKTSITGLTGLITNVNRELLTKWKRAARRSKAVNVTRDVSFMVLKLTAIAIFGDDYPLVEPHLSVLTQETARDLNFVNMLRPLSDAIAQIAQRRRREATDASERPRLK